MSARARARDCGVGGSLTAYTQAHADSLDPALPPRPYARTAPLRPYARTAPLPPVAPPGPHATLRLLHRTPTGTPLFHEAGIYLPSQHAVYLSSNRLPYAPARQRITIVRVPLDAIPPVDFTAAAAGKVGAGEAGAGAGTLLPALEVAPEGAGGLPQHLAMPNGATRWVDADGREGVLWCEQGRHLLDGQAAGSEVEVESALVAFTPPPAGAPLSKGKTAPLLKAYEGKPFTSLNDVVLHEQSGVVFFTDPDYGVVQSFKRSHEEQAQAQRQRAQGKGGAEGYAPNALYAWYPPTGEVRLLDERYDKRECRAVRCGEG